MATAMDTFSKGKGGKTLSPFESMLRRVKTWDAKRLARETIRLHVEYRDLPHTERGEDTLHRRIATALLKEQEGQQ